ncbi:hypothetical protein HYZ98_03275 [Candidatus Peregrinibacteria bacterium]|nr:hypothetical protein [Candidatus Peregrinibacteria bacterium]
MADDASPKDSKAAPPPRPGDPVPEGGLDPTQVFASPPPPPPGARSAQGGPPQDDAAAGSGQGGAGQVAGPPQDAGPPPPPAGPLASDEELKAKGYDDEDIRVLKEVGDYRFGGVVGTLTNDNIVVPLHADTTFDEQGFLKLLRGSISLTRDEKWRIIQAVPKLSQFQVDELQKILEEERHKFGELSPKHLSQLKRLEGKHAEDWRDLQSMHVQQQVKSEEKEKAEAIRKKLGL